MPCLYNIEKEKPINYEGLFKKKKNFAFIGNFKHTPNYEAVKILLKIWP